MSAASSSFLEPLEPRIAPAVLVNGANLLGGTDNPLTGEASAGEDAYTAIKVTTGSVIVWYDNGSITGISAGQGASFEVWGNIYGDIVGNLTSAGRLSDSDNDPTNGEDGNVLLANDILGVTVHAVLGEDGSIGHIVTGGSISNVNIEGKTHGLYAGNGLFDTASTLAVGGTVTVNVGMVVNPLGDPLDAVDDTAFVFHSGNYGTPKSGASISNVVIKNGIELQLIAGDGTVAGGAGGSITNVSIESAAVESGATVSYSLLAGDGAAGINGGAGGSITSVVEKASSQTAIYEAGDGGAGTAGSGGLGGSISKINAQSDQTSYVVHAGAGGSGTYNGGNGGSLIQNSFAGSDPKTGILASGDFTGDGLDDILVVDSGSGQMVVMQNMGGSNFTPIEQVHNLADPNDDNDFIYGVGVTPRAAVVGDFDGDGDLDIAVAYGNSSSIGIFLNDTGQFTGASFSTGLSPVDIAVGHFTSAATLDIAILANTNDGAVVLLAAGNGTGGFSLLSTSVSLGKTKNAVDMVSAHIDGNALDDLFVGYANGPIRTLLATGSTTSVFQVSTNVVSSVSNLSNLDVDEATSQLLAFSAQGKAISLFTYDSGSLVPSASVLDISTLGGQPMVARFGGLVDGNIQILTTQARASQITEYTLQSGLFAASRVISGDGTLKTFISTEDGSGVAALAGSLNRMEYNLGGTEFIDIALPFSGKALEAIAGDGGDANTGKAGAGGAITALNAEADSVILITGTGGDSVSGAAGAGGAFTNSGTVLLAGGGSVAAAISADTSIVITTGAGGSVSAGIGAAGSGGVISGLTATVKAGNFDISTGNGGSAFNGLAGHGGAITSTTLTSKGGNISLVTGDGGSTVGGKNAGNGGSVTSLKYTQELDAETDALGLAYTVTMTTGEGGSANSGIGGSGGSFTGLTIYVDPSDINPDAIFDLADGTTSVNLKTGDGGNGLSGGGAGGSFTTVLVQANFDQRKIDPLNPKKSYLIPNFVTLQMQAGDGGHAGSLGTGGAGGSITSLKAKSITQYDVDSAQATDAALQLTAGDGGNGGVAGGKGGVLSGIASSNAQTTAGTVVNANLLSSAILVGGDGGNGGTSLGGAGGSVINAVVAVAGGQLEVTAGAGGNSTGNTGGAGGAVTSGSYAAAVVAVAGGASPIHSITITAGDGGSGLLLGGAGGALSSFTVNSPQQNGIYGSILTAGNGGDSTATSGLRAAGGVGGSVTGIKQPKDLNSFLTLIQAGNGGNSIIGLGGNGGSVTSISSAGFIGRPYDDAHARLGVYDNGQLQGIFAGLGGDSVSGTDGLAGSIASIVARQIAALGGAELPGGTFGLATAIIGVKADVIGFDANGNGIFEGPQSPTQQVPLDGFLLAKAITGVQTYNPVRTAAFSFTS